MSVEMSVTLPNSDTPKREKNFGADLSTGTSEGPFRGSWEPSRMRTYVEKKSSLFHRFFGPPSHGYQVSRGINVEQIFELRKTLVRKMTTNFLTVDDTAAYLKVSKSTVQRLIREHDIDVTRIGRSVRISEEAIERYVDAHTTYGYLSRGRL